MLSFAAPAFLWLGLLAAVILLLHTRRQRRKVVGSLQIWRQLQMPAGARRTRQWPPLTLPLVLQLAALAALTLALAQPFRTQDARPEHLVVVLDTSGSMGVRDGDTRRIDAARERLAGMLNARDTIGPERISLISAGVRPRFEAARQPWRDGIFGETLPRLRVSDGPADWRAVAALLPSVVRAGEETRVLFISSGPPPDELVSAANSPVSSVRIGTPQDRPMLLSAQVVPVDPAENEWRIDGRADLPAGIAEAAVEIVYAASVDDPPLPWTTISLAASGDEPVSFSRTLELPGTGILTLLLSGADPSETVRFILTDEPATMDILYIGQGEQPLLRALQAIEGVELFQADTLPDDVSRFGLIVLDDVVVPRQPEGNTVWIGRARLEGEAEPAPMTAPDPDNWDHRHPLSRDIDWTGLAIATGFDIRLLSRGEKLLGSRGYPLIEAWSSENGRNLRLAFDPADSDWPDRSSFAVFAAALIDWLGQRPGELQAPACTVGGVCAVDARWVGETLTPASPDAEPFLISTSPFVPEDSGLFRTPDGGLLAINPAPSPDTVGGEEPAAFRLPRGGAVWLLCLATAVIAAECALAARRVDRRWPVGPLGVAAVALAALAIGNPPLPGVAPAEAVVLVGPPRIAPHGSDDEGYAQVEAGAPPVIVDAGPDIGPGRIADADSAIALAAAMLPDDRRGRIVLGSELASRVVPPAPASVRGVRIDYIPAEVVPAGDVSVRDVELPARLIAGDATRLVGLVHAASPTPVTLTVLKDGQEIARRDIELAAGDNRTELVLPSIASGETLLEVAVESPSDPFPQNNRAGKIVTVQPAKPIAVLAPSLDHATAFAALLEAQGLEPRVMSPARSPQYLEGWLEYGGVVLLNVPAISLSVRQQELLETAVREHGLGALILGGANSFGPGGYFATALEQVSPLSSRVPREAPEVAMLFVLDRSGSMQQQVGDGNRLDVAKHATLSAISLLNPESQVGIVVFDEEPRVILPMGRLDVERAQTALAQLDPGGGTAIFPALSVAAEIMAGVEAPARHIVVMTDGLSQPGDFPSVLQRLNAAGVTVSAVAIGEGADVDVVHAIAAMGGGTAHATEDFEALPSILSQEAMLLSTPVEEGTSQPRWHDTDASFLTGLPDPMPPIDGFVLTTAKPGARLALSTPDSKDEDMPLMAWWRYGNGFALALSTDATSLWTRRWHALDQYAQLWARALREFQPPTPASNSLTVSGDHETMRVMLTALDENGEPVTGIGPTAMLTSPGGSRSVPVTLREEAPGHYRAEVPLAEPGRYLAEVTLSDMDKPLTAAFHHSYQAQFDFAAPVGGAEALARVTGGEPRGQAEALKNQAGLQFHWWTGWRVFALLALGLFMGDLITRYTGVSLRKSRQLTDAMFARYRRSPG